MVPQDLGQEPVFPHSFINDLEVVRNDVFMLSWRLAQAREQENNETNRLNKVRITTGLQLRKINFKILYYFF